MVNLRISCLNRKLLRDILRLKGQVLAISLVVACGIATYIMSQTAVRSLDVAKDSYFDRYRIADIYAQAKRVPMRLLQQVQAIEGVVQTYSRINFGVTLDVPGMDEPATALILSVPETGDIPLNGLYLVSGRFLEPGETGHILVSEAFASAHTFKPGDKFSAVINARKRELTIAGIVLSPEFVYSLAPGNIFPDDKRYGVLYMNRRALEAATNMDGAFNDLTVKLAPKANEEQIIARINTLLEPYGGRDAFSKDDQISYWFIQNELLQLRTIGWVVPAIFLTVASFLLNIVLSRQVSTERDQIGMLKAIGYHNIDIGLHYIGFALTIVIFGALMGTGLGIWLGSGLMNIYALYFHFPSLDYIFAPSTLAFSGLISLVAAIVGTLNAVRAVVVLPPAEAMHPAPPMIYRKTLLERLHILQMFSTTARMIFRHLERRPLRAVLSVTGVALSTAIFLASAFAIDSIDFMLDVQFEVADRADVSLTFVEPRSAQALDEIIHLPGVMATEPYRMVPARLKFGHKSHRGGITGITPTALLKRMVNEDISPVTMPESGVMLSEKLGRLLGASRGDLVTLEVLEGRRPTVQVRVAGIVQEFVGANAFMNLDALNRLMGDGNVISGAALLTSGSADEALYKKVKNIPIINSVIMRSVLVQSVRKTMTESIVETFVINVVFAALIAFGVIYNTARISLAERARELGSMRVLGFTNGEITFVMLGELLLLVLVAIPIGIWMGVGMGTALAATMDTELFRLPTIFSQRTIAATILITLSAAAVSAYVVARRIKKLDIVKVLKTRE